MSNLHCMEREGRAGPLARSRLTCLARLVSLANFLRIPERRSASAVACEMRLAIVELLRGEVDLPVGAGCRFCHWREHTSDGKLAAPNSQPKHRIRLDGLKRSCGRFVQTSDQGHRHQPV